MEEKSLKVGAPIQVKGVGVPISVKPIGNVTPVGKVPSAVTQQPAATSTTNTEDNGYDALFGSGSSTSTTEAQNTKDASKTTTEEKSKEATSKKSKKKEEEKEEKKEEKYNGPRKVKVYGQTLFTEDNPNVTLEQIRQRIVTEYGYDEFSSSKTIMYLDNETGIVVPQIPFQKKG